MVRVGHRFSVKDRIRHPVFLSFCPKVQKPDTQKTCSEQFSTMKHVTLKKYITCGINQYSKHVASAYVLHRRHDASYHNRSLWYSSHNTVLDWIPQKQSLREGRKCCWADQWNGRKRRMVIRAPVRGDGEHSELQLAPSRAPCREDGSSHSNSTPGTTLYQPFHWAELPVGNIFLFYGKKTVGQMVHTCNSKMQETEMGLPRLQ